MFVPNCLLYFFLGVNDEQELFQADLGFGDLWRLMLQPQSWSYVFNLWMLKVSIALGFVHEKLFLSEHGFWLTKAWRTGFFIFVSLVLFSSVLCLFFSVCLFFGCFGGLC